MGKHAYESRRDTLAQMLKVDLCANGAGAYAPYALPLPTGLVNLQDDVRRETYAHACVCTKRVITIDISSYIITKGKCVI